MKSLFNLLLEKPKQWTSVTFMRFQVLALLEVKKWIQRQINFKTIPNYYYNFFFQGISTKTYKLEISIFYIQNICSSPTKLKGFGGFRLIIYFCSKKTRFLFWVTHEKFQKPKYFCFLFPKIFHRKGLKNGWKKFTEKVWACASGKGLKNGWKKGSMKKFEHARPKDQHEVRHVWCIGVLSFLFGEIWMSTQVIWHNFIKKCQN